MGNLDPTVQVAALGLISALMSSLTIIAVARINKKDPAPIAVPEGETEEVLRERVTFHKERADSAERTVDRKEATIQRLLHEMEELKHELAAERAKNEQHGD